MGLGWLSRILKDHLLLQVLHIPPRYFHSLNQKTFLSFHEKTFLSFFQSQILIHFFSLISLNERLSFGFKSSVHLTCFIEQDALTEEISSLA